MSRLLLNIITPCTQTENLELLHKSIISAKKDLPIDIKWHIVFDTMSNVGADEIKSTDLLVSISYAGNTESVAGSAQINHALGSIKEGYIYILKDDNLVHPDMFDFFHKGLESQPSKSAGFIVEQYLEDDEIRPIKPLPSFIDCAQFIVDSSVVEDVRLHLGISSADGIFIQQIYNKHQENFIFVNKPLSFLKKVDEYRLLEKAPSSFGIGSLVGIDNDHFFNTFSKITTFMIQGTIMKLRRQLRRKMIIANIMEEKDVYLVTILPPRKSNIAWRQGKGTVLKFETREQAERIFNLVSKDK